ncbi:MAG: PfkB family carbohydrate kinase [Candidatus Diapherotrites archaeon]|nr:PfkB family carbohydrate kinase [Candidatus Diapherotrites archaeon]
MGRAEKTAAEEKKRIVVVGDVLLDKYDYCTNRDNPESSAPSYTVQETVYLPGGAGNVAANLKSLGAETKLIGVIGKDDNAKILKRALAKLGIKFFIIEDKKRKTIVKERTMSKADGRYHFRKDIEQGNGVKVDYVSKIMKQIGNCAIIIVSDYNKGTVSEKLMKKLKAKGIPIIVDPKPAHISFYKNVFLVTPNTKEALEMSKKEDDFEAAKFLQKRLNTRILLKRGKEGVAYFEKGKKPFAIGTEAKKVFDVTGAGDTVVATFAHFYSKGLELREAIRLANRAAGIAVAYPGCYHVKEKEILP